MSNIPYFQIFFSVYFRMKFWLRTAAFDRSTIAK